MLLLYTYYSVLILYVLIVFLLPTIGFITKISKTRSTQNHIGISIIIPFRNEVKTLNDLCESINALNYPRSLFEVIFVDDGSTDNSLSLLQKIEQDIYCDIVQNPQHLGKKAAILEGISRAKYDYILTTDADCQLPKDLLSHIQENIDLSLGTVIKATNNWSIIENMQETESLFLAGVTLGSAQLEIPMLASGANLVYRKSIIEETLPYSDNMDINSGDDMFLLKAAQVHNLKISARSGAPVITYVEKTWKSYIDQAVRWSGKNNRVNLIQSSVAAWMVLIANLWLPLSLITHSASGWIILMIKFVVDFLFLFLTATYYERYKAILFAPIVFIIYPIHLVLVMTRIINMRKKGQKIR